MGYYTKRMKDAILESDESCQVHDYIILHDGV